MIRYRALIAWLLIAFALCLLPGPLYWSDRFQSAGVNDSGNFGGDALAESERELAEPGDDGAVTKPTAVGEDSVQTSGNADSGAGPSSLIAKVMNVVLAQRQHEKEFAVHLLLMCGVAFCLSRSLFAGLQPLLAVLASLVLVGLIALLIEGLQELLPDFFKRGFSWDDLWFSLAGGLIGAVAGVLRGRSHA